MINYFELGASLYTPADHKDLLISLTLGIADAKSIVICTEDAVSENQLEHALKNLSACLSKFHVNHETNFIRLIRPRNPEILDRILKMDGIEKIDGFVLPKATSESLLEYRKVFKKNASNKRFSLLPTLETKEALSNQGLQSIRQTMDSFKDDIVCIRIGGNDLMNILGIKRMPGLTIYETPVRNVIDNIIIEFRTHGYEISAPVFDYIDDRITLEKELRQDINYGFFAKTAIHPSQISIIELFFKEYLSEYSAIAESLVTETSRAVYKSEGQMMEVTCHMNWAKRTVAFTKAMNSFKKPENLTIAKSA
jgi:citrate lyase beta subunit